jgi:ABC-type transporter Mla MlaB component
MGISYGDWLALNNKLDAILILLSGLASNIAALTLKQEQAMTDLTALTVEVARNTEVDTSAIALLTGLAAQIEALKTDPAALQALADTMRGSSDALAAAVLANTPAAPV